MPLLNLRDVAEGAGTPVRSGMLLRSAQPHRLTAADTDRLADLLGGQLEGLRLVADLRSEAELAGDDWTLLTDLGVRVTRLGTSGSPADLSALPPGINLGDLYVLMLDHRTAWFASVVAEIADGLPALVHCAAGKDRTGLVVALILDLVGVDHEAIVRDYAATVTHLPQIMTMLGLTTPPPAASPLAVPSPAASPLATPPPVALSPVALSPAASVSVAGAVSGLLDAPETAIRTFLTALDARGGAERLLTAHGLTEGHVQRLRAALVG
ncbi:tyrosine-protein phosphatase [Streptosporangium sp. NPDC000239]|uniref:tyrosine-protein phosphatase n=1 Tax=Streptosporangium sp. NPDC000239 TaxID=3154248 RepID=UPI003326BB46